MQKILIVEDDIDIQDTNDVDVTLVHYVGRRHPVSYYGTQLGHKATWNTTIPKNDTETIYMLRRLAIWQGDVYVRVLHDARTKKLHNERAIKNFQNDCAAFEQLYPNIKFWCGKNLYNWTNDYEFKNNPSCAEYYSSVVLPKIDDLYPRCYAKKNNKMIYEKGTDKDILLLDFVNYVV